MVSCQSFESLTTVSGALWVGRLVTFVQFHSSNPIRLLKASCRLFLLSLEVPAAEKDLLNRFAYVKQQNVVLCRKELVAAMKLARNQDIGG